MNVSCMHDMHTRWTAARVGPSAMATAKKAETDAWKRVGRWERIEKMRKMNVKKFFKDGLNGFKKWKDNPRSDNSGLDDDGAQV